MKSVNQTTRDRVVVDNLSLFKKLDTVLIIQMKGAVIDTLNDHRLIAPINSAGKYEFIQVEDTIGSTVIFTDKFLNKYDNGEAIQLVKVRSYNTVKVASLLTCLPWDGKKGGIVAFFAEDTLILDADIDVSGKGFLGASPIRYDGSCDFGERYYADMVAGKKGEGIVGKYFNKNYGVGFLANGGGGGNGKYAGGGGGGGFGEGGGGNRMTLLCPDESNKTGGEPGIGFSASLDYYNGADYEHRDRIFFGGGGGSGTYPDGAVSSKGGNGGGIVFIIARNFIPNNYVIKANGESVIIPSTNNAGTGGGGGGGNISIYSEKIEGTFKAEVKGGSGGGNTKNEIAEYCSGQGGGGGGGLIWFTASKTDIIDSTFLTEGGKSGDYRSATSCGLNSNPGTQGNSLRGLMPVLNGFLYNVINEPHTICYGQPSLPIVGSNPRGGNGIYAYKWIKRKYNVKGWELIDGALNKDYTAPALYDTTIFRRIVSTSKINSEGATIIMTDSSKALQVNVIPQIINNKINPNYTEICSGQPAVNLIGEIASRQGGTVAYSWQTQKPRYQAIDVNSVEKDYSQTFNTATNVSDTTYYYRTATSLFCKVTDKATIIVHPVLTNNSISVNLVKSYMQEICSGLVPKQIDGTTPLGGKAGQYIYSWEKSSDTTNWSLLADSSFQNLNFGSLIDTTYYRRIVSSGLNNVCTNITNAFLISVLPKIDNNTITSSQSFICEETAPKPFVNSLPTGGNNIFVYQWIKSQNGESDWDSILSTSDREKYPNNRLSVPTSYKRVVRSGLYDCCIDTSEVTVTFSIQPKFRNGLISPDTTICTKQQPNKIGPRHKNILSGGKLPYKYQWYSRIDKSNTWSLSASDSVLQPVILKDTSYFRRIVFSSDSVCSDTANMIVNVLPSIKNNIIEGENAVCNDSTLAQINGDKSLGGGNMEYRYVWDYKAANESWKSTQVTWANYPATILNSVTDSIITTFRRTVYSGLHDCCVDTSAVHDVEVFARPISGGALIDTSVVFNFTYNLKAPKPILGRGVWTIVGYDIQPVHETETTATVTLPDPDLKYGIYWVITTNKVCPSLIDSFAITIKDIKRYNGFSPNGDQKNDYFIISGLQNLKENGDFWELKILNRWGGLVYSADINNNRLKDLADDMPYTEIGIPLWDGKNINAEDVAEDTYYYVLTVFKKNDKPRDYKGFVVMKR